MQSPIGLRHMAAVLLCAVLAGGAQAQQPVFNSQNISVDALVNELDPVTTRSIRVVRDEPKAQASASLLVTFVTNSSELTADARANLDMVARALQADRLADFSFNVEGHADPRGQHDANMRLSQARAESVADYLASQHHIDRARLKAIGKGDTELANTAQPTAPENRRVTFVTVTN